MKELTERQNLHCQRMGISVRSFFQPIVCLKSGKIFAYEALIRGWSNKSEKIIAPNELFSHAQDMNISKEFDQLCQQSAMTFYKDFGKKSDALLFLNINTDCISSGVTDDKILHTLTERMGFHPNVIGLELIESKEKSANELIYFVQQQRENGFIIVVDDFGSEHSNIERLILIHPDIIKIDRNIIHGIDKDSYRQSILKSIHSLSQMTGAVCLAEGVETEAEVITCAKLGVDLFQGFAIAKPAADLFLLEKETKAIVQNYREIIKKEIIGDLRVTRRLTGDVNHLADWLIRQLDFDNMEAMEPVFIEFMILNSEIECIYLIDAQGIQISNTVMNPLITNLPQSYIFNPGEKGADHSLKPYYTCFVAFKINRYLTDKYLSWATGNLCRTLSVKIEDKPFYLCIDFLEEQIKTI